MPECCPASSPRWQTGRSIRMTGMWNISMTKLDALEDIIESMNGKPLLVAYWYQHDLDRIEERLRMRKIGFARLDSDASIAKWNRGEIPVALIHPASAGHGLNLQARFPSAGLALPGAWNCTSRRWRGFTGRVRRPRP